MRSTTAVVQKQDGGDEKKCNRCDRSVDGGNFVERMNGEGTQSKKTGVLLCFGCAYVMPGGRSK